MNPEPESQGDAFFLLQPLIQVFHRSEDAQPSPYCSLGVILMRLRIPKVHQETVSQELSGVSFVALDDFSADVLVGTHYVPILFGIELGGELGGIDQVTKHHRELTAFCFRDM